MPLALFVAGITVPIFPLLSEQVAANAPEKVKATLSFALRLMGFLMIPATVGIILLRDPLIGAIYRHGEFTAQDAWRTSWVLLFECLGLYFYAGRDTLTRVFYSYHDTRTPVKISAATVFLNIAISFGFMSLIRSFNEEAAVSGLTLGTTIALTINFFVLVYLLHRKVGQIGFRSIFRSLLGVVGLSGAMGVVIWVVDFFLARSLPAETDGFVIRLVVGIVAGGGMYLLLARLFKVPEFAEITGMLGSVFKRMRRGGGQPA
jgi:putative peptidoglycan lipid II flippase